MKPAAKIELALIPIAVGAVGWGSRQLPTRLQAGTLLAVCCLSWLVQGGLRDVWFLYRLKSQPTVNRRRMACMCVESSVGLTGILAGVALALQGVGGEIQLDPFRWTALAAVTFALGFIAKDWIVTWRPLGLRRDPDHHSIIFSWR